MTRPYRSRPLDAAELVCVRCGERKPAADFRLVRGRWKSSWCDACYLARTREWRADNPEYVAAYNAARRVHPEPRACAGCGRTFTPRRRDAVFCCHVCGDASRTYGRFHPDHVCPQKETEP